MPGLQETPVLRPVRPLSLATAVLGTALAAAFLGTALTLLPAVAEQAAPPRQQNLAQLISDAQMIVGGKVVRVADGVSPKGLPYTEITLAVQYSLRGSLRGGASYRFRQFGLVAPRKMPDGRMLLAVSPAGFPRWQEGEQVLAFLQPPAVKTGLQTTCGLAQGKFNVLDGKVFNESGNRGLFDGLKINGVRLGRNERAMLASKGPVDAATFVGLVGRAVSEDWISTGKMR
jgi:hypothetical protein